MGGHNPDEGLYFSLREIGIIIILSILAAVTGALVPSYLFPEGRISDFVYNVLHLPGPGAGVMLFGGILCFWLVLGLIVIKKPGAAVAISVVLMAIDLLTGNQAILIQTLDVLLFVALIIEALCLVPVKNYYGDRVLPLIFILLSAATIILALAGLATQGETDSAVSQFPWIYYLMGILGCGFAWFCYRYPVNYIAAAGVANMYYMLHFWLFWGDGIATRFPPDPAMIPVLFLAALLGGAIAALAAYSLAYTHRRYFSKAQKTGEISS
jgi:hypothetical protein